MKKYFLWIFIVFFYVSCTPTSKEDFEMEGRSLAKSILKDLRSVQTLEDLKSIHSQLEEKYLQVADLMIESTKQGTTIHSDDHLDPSISDQLLQEYQRIYQIPEGRRIMEEIQSRGLIRLDRFNRDFLK